MKKYTLNGLLVITAILIWLVVLNRLKSPGIYDTQHTDTNHTVKFIVPDSCREAASMLPARNPFLYVRPSAALQKKDSTVQKKIVKIPDAIIINMEILGIIEDASSGMAVIRYRDSMITFVREHDTLFEYTVIQIDTGHIVLAPDNRMIRLTGMP